MDEDNNMAVFKSYLRALLSDLKDIQKALNEKRYEDAEKKVSELIEDTQKGIEDN